MLLARALRVSYHGVMRGASHATNSDKHKPPATGAPPSSTQDRLQKVLAAAGVGSRRHCEELIQAGRVEVDGKVETHLGTKVDARSQQIRVDGVALTRPRAAYYAVNKPRGVVSTNSDPAGRPRVIDLLPQRGQRLFTVGRLDMSSEGLILVTNDGELANRLAHPRYGVEKTYQVEIAGRVEREDFAPLRKGLHLAEGVARATTVRIKAQHGKSTVLEIVLSEGKNREIRRLLARMGHKVLRLKRIALGPLRLGELAPGEVRLLARRELEELRAASGMAASKRRRRVSHGGSGQASGHPKSRPRKKAVRSGKSNGSAAPRGPTVIGGDRPQRRPAVKGIGRGSKAKGRVR